MVQAATDVAGASIDHPGIVHASGIDLQQFCSTDEFRPNLQKPFRYKGHVYATDGRILVRVEDDERFETCEKIAIEKMIDFDAPRIFVDAPTTKKFPTKKPPAKTKCTDCDGRGREHDCPDCECECYSCDGEGEIEERPLISTTFAGQLFDFEYMRMVCSLPELRYAANPTADDECLRLGPLFFRFAGGICVVMPLSRKHDMHVDILAAPSPA